MRPIDVNETNEQEIFDRLYRDALENSAKRSPDYVKGDKVRIAKQKTVFEKAYLPTYSEDIYVVRNVKKGRPHAYGLTDTQGEPIRGRFYKEELSRTKYDRKPALVIEEVLKTRKRRGGIHEYLVKYKGREGEDWITDADLL